jgi:hypothetical protein
LTSLLFVRIIGISIEYELPEVVEPRELSEKECRWLKASAENPRSKSFGEFAEEIRGRESRTARVRPIARDLDDGLG